MISYEIAKRLLDRLPVIEHFSPNDDEWVTIERYAEKSSDPNFRSIVRHRIKGRGNYGSVSQEEIRNYFAYGFSDFFDNPNVRLIGKNCGWGRQEIYYVYSDNHLLVRLYEAKIRLRGSIRLLNRRVLETLCIWNLAEREIGMYPQWSDVRLVKLFVRTIKWLEENLLSTKV